MDLDRISDETLVKYYQNLMFNLAKSSKDIQNIFLTAYYGMTDCKQNKLINKINLYTILGFSAAKIISGINHPADINVYLLGLLIGAYNTVAGHLNNVKLMANKNLLTKFILKNIDDQYALSAALDTDNTKMQRIIDCMDKAFLNIIHSKSYMIRIQNYKAMSKSSGICDFDKYNFDPNSFLKDGITLLSRSLLNSSPLECERTLKTMALSGDPLAIICYYLTKPKEDSSHIDAIVQNYTLEDMETSYIYFMAVYLSGLKTDQQMQIIKKQAEINTNTYNLFLDSNGKLSDIGAIFQCMYYESTTARYMCDDQDFWNYKSALKYLKKSKTDFSLFYKATRNFLLEKGKTKLNAAAMLVNFAHRGIKSEVLDEEYVIIETDDKQIEKNK